MDSDKEAAIVACARKNQRNPATYKLVLDLVDYVVARRGQGRKHCSTEELIYGLAIFAAAEFGLLAHCVLGSLGLCSSDDLGKCVFELIEAELLSKTANDRFKDFAGRYWYDAESFAGVYAQLLTALEP